MRHSISIAQLVIQLDVYIAIDFLKVQAVTHYSMKHFRVDGCESLDNAKL